MVRTAETALLVDAVLLVKWACPDQEEPSAKSEPRVRTAACTARPVRQDLPVMIDAINYVCKPFAWVGCVYR